jgi:RNA polymerase sigma factor (sigma-70 family)
MPAAEAPSHPAPRGDEEALYRAHHRSLLRMVASDVNTRPHVIEDACSFAWAKLLAYQPERTTVVGWLRVVARHEAIRLDRRDRATISLSQLFVDDTRRRGSVTGGPHATPEQCDEARDALNALAALPARKRAFLSLKVGGYSYDEIAKQLGTTWRTVNRQLVRARRTVRDARETGSTSK